MHPGFRVFLSMFPRISRMMRYPWETKVTTGQPATSAQGVLYYFIENMNDYAIPDNASFLEFSETHQEILVNQDLYSWNDEKKKWS